jgi:hypothetical protein
MNDFPLDDDDVYPIEPDDTERDADGEPIEW